MDEGLDLKTAHVKVQKEDKIGSAYVVPIHHYVGRKGYHIYGWSARQCRTCLGYTGIVTHQTGIF